MLEKIKKNITKYDTFLPVIIMFLILIYSLLFYTYHLPLRSCGYDTYHHLGILRAVESKLSIKNNIDPEFFPGLYRNDPHIGTNFIGMTLISSTFGISNIDTLFLFGIFNILFLFTSLYAFVYQYSKSKKIALVSVIVSMIFTSAHSWVATGLFSVTDIIVIAHYPAVFALSVALLLLSLNVRYLHFPQKKLLILQFILFFVLFTSHMLTGFIYIFILFLLLITQFIQTKKIERQCVSLSLVIPIVLIVALLWPFYNWWDIFFHSEPIQTGAPPIDLYSYRWVSDCLRLYDIGAIILLFGGFFLIRRKDVFLLLWASIFFTVAISFILPFRPPLYWRFVPFVKIPLIIGFSGWLVNNSKQLLLKSPFILVILLMVSFSLTSSFGNSIIPLITKDDVSVKYTFLSQFDEKDWIILTYDPSESYVIQGITNFSTVTVPWDHCSNIFLWPELKKRYEEIQNVYESNDSGKWDELIEKYHVDYVLFNKYYKAHNIGRTLLNGIVVYSDKSFELIKVFHDE